MIEDRQVRKLRKLLSLGTTFEKSAMKSGRAGA